MGEVSELMEEGVLCQECGGVMEDYDTDGELPQLPGYPRTCRYCKEGEGAA